MPEIEAEEKAIEVAGRNGWFDLSAVQTREVDGIIALEFRGKKSWSWRAPMTIQGRKDKVRALLAQLLAETL